MLFLIYGRGKLDDKAIKCRLIGFTHNGYKMLTIDDKQVIETSRFMGKLGITMKESY
jgi:hypothetical protein